MTALDRCIEVKVKYKIVVYDFSKQNLVSPKTYSPARLFHSHDLYVLPLHYGQCHLEMHQD